MIDFGPLWITMEKRGISQYSLLKHYHMSCGQLDRLRKNSNVSTYTINRLCEILDCQVDEVIEYKPPEESK